MLVGQLAERDLARPGEQLDHFFLEGLNVDRTLLFAPASGSHRGGSSGLPLTRADERDTMPRSFSSLNVSVDPELQWVLLEPLFCSGVHDRLALVLPELMVKRIDHLRQ